MVCMKLKTLTLLALLFTGFKLFAQPDSTKITFIPLTKNVYVFTYYMMISGSPYPCNGLYAVTKQGIMLIDMPSNEALTQQFIDSLEKRHHQKIVLSISTHFHDDRTGGINTLRQAGVKTYSSVLTKQLCKKEGNDEAEYTFTKDTAFTLGGVTMETYYPGAGHTKDNIVVWLPQQKILFGGCFVKSTETNSIGNIADADIMQWPASIKNVMSKYRDAKYVIPGHQSWSNPNGLQHTLDILAAVKK